MREEAESFYHALAGAGQKVGVGGVSSKRRSQTRASYCIAEQERRAGTNDVE
jgi:hypothetical protein